MYTLVIDFNSPSDGIRGDMNRSPGVDSFYRITKLFRLSWFNLILVLFSI